MQMSGFRTQEIHVCTFSSPTWKETHLHVRHLPPDALNNTDQKHLWASAHCTVFLLLWSVNPSPSPRFYRADMFTMTPSPFEVKKWGFGEGNTAWRGESRNSSSSLCLQSVRFLPLSRTASTHQDGSIIISLETYAK